MMNIVNLTIPTRVLQAHTPNANAENKEARKIAVQDADPSANEGSSSTSIQNQFLRNNTKRTISQKLKDICHADNFKNLSILEEENCYYESSSFDEVRSAERGLESDLGDASDEPQRKSSVKESHSCVPKRE